MSHGLHNYTNHLVFIRFGGGPVCNRLVTCQACQEELDSIKARQQWEMETFVRLNEEFNSNEVQYTQINALSMAWFKDWEMFVKTRTDGRKNCLSSQSVDCRLLQTLSLCVCLSVCGCVCLSRFYGLYLAYYGSDFDQT